MNKPDECKGCPLYETGNGFVPPHGPDTRGGVMLVGQWPEQYELEVGTPFARVRNEQKRSESFGLHLARWLNRAGMTWENVHKTNVLWCKPPTEFPPSGAVQHCTKHYLKRYLAHRKPDVIITFGQLAFKTFSVESPLASWRGQVLRDTAVRREMRELAPNVVPTLLNVMRAWEYVPVVVNDMRRAKAVADGVWQPERITVHRELNDEIIREILQAPAVGIDTEGTSAPILIGISWKRGHATAVTPDRYGGFIQTLLTNGPPVLYIHNGFLFDADLLRTRYIVDETRIFDTMLASWLINGGDLPVSLAFNASVHTDVPYWKWRAVQYGYGDIEYCATDAAVHYMLGEQFTQQLAAKSLDKLYERIVVPLARRVCVLNRRGVKIDMDRFYKARAALDMYSEEVRTRLTRVVGNPNSYTQVLKAFKRAGVPEPYSKSEGRASTEADALKEWLLRYGAAYPEFAAFVNDLLEYRKALKQLSTYFNVGNLRGDIFPARYMLHAGSDDSKRLVSTGRLSSSPNIQNWPREGAARSCVVPHNAGWVFVEFDYKQQEYLDALRAAGDYKLAGAVVRGEFDIHTYVASQVGGISRDVAKRITYLTLYGGGAVKISKLLQIPEAIARAAQKAFYEASPALKHWHQELIEYARRHYHTKNEYGRLRYHWVLDVPKVLDLPQSNCADYNNNHWVNYLVPALPYGAEQVDILVHDAVIIECPREEVDETVRKGIEALSCPDWGINYSYPVSVKVGESWGEMTTYIL